MEEDKERITKICTHEAGHYIVGRELGFKTKGIDITINKNVGHSGNSTIELWTPSLDNIQKTKDYIEKRVQVLLAGAMSEATDKNQNYDGDYACKEWESGGAIIDYARVRELIQLLRNISFPDTKDETSVQKELNQLEQQCMIKTDQILQNRHHLILEISALLSSKVKEYDTKYKLTENEINSLESISKAYKLP